MPNEPVPNQPDLSSRITALEELVTYQEQTIDALNEVVLELRGTVEELTEKVARIQESNQSTTASNPGGELGLPPRPEKDPEAPPHY